MVLQTIIWACSCRPIWLFWTTFLHFSYSSVTVRPTLYCLRRVIKLWHSLPADRVDWLILHLYTLNKTHPLIYAFWFCSLCFMFMFCVVCLIHCLLFSALFCPGLLSLWVFLFSLPHCIILLFMFLQIKWRWNLSNDHVNKARRCKALDTGPRPNMITWLTSVAEVVILKLKWF